MESDDELDDGMSGPANSSPIEKAAEKLPKIEEEEEEFLDGLVDEDEDAMQGVVEYNEDDMEVD